MDARSVPTRVLGLSLEHMVYMGPLTTLPPQQRWPDVRVACVWLPQLPLRAEILRHPGWQRRPVVMGGGPGERKVVLLCSPLAEEAGILPGLPLREVLALSREAIVLQPDPVRTATVLEDVRLRLQQVGPAIELSCSEEGVVFLDLHGLAQVYEQDIQRLESAIHNAVPALLQPRIGFAAGKFAASVAARLAPMDRCSSVVPAVETAVFLAPLPVQHLPFTPEVLERLELLGIHTIGEVAALPFSAVQAQFGRAGALAWRLAHGRDDDPVVAQPSNPGVRAALRCDDPLASVDAVLAALDQLLIRAFANPVMRGGSARQVRLRALLSDSTSWERAFTFKEALAGPHAARRVLWAKLKAASMLPPAPVEELSLELLGLGPEVARQLPLFGNRIRQQRQLAEANRQLTARYGQTPLYQPVEVEPWSRIPERRWALSPLHSTR